MINFNSNVNSVGPGQIGKTSATGNGANNFSESVKAVTDGIKSVDESQKAADVSIKDLLAGNNDDITSVVSEVAKADMSFKLLVGVRNKLIEAYQQTMNMQI